MLIFSHPCVRFYTNYKTEDLNLYIFTFSYNYLFYLCTGVSIFSHLSVAKVLIFFFFSFLSTHCMLLLFSFSVLIPVIISYIHEFRGLPFLILPGGRYSSSPPPRVSLYSFCARDHTSSAVYILSTLASRRSPKKIHFHRHKFLFHISVSYLHIIKLFTIELYICIIFFSCLFNIVVIALPLLVLFLISFSCLLSADRGER